VLNLFVSVSVSVFLYFCVSVYVGVRVHERVNVSYKNISALLPCHWTVQIALSNALLLGAVLLRTYGFDSRKWHQRFPLDLDPREGPPWGPEQGSSQESRESQSKIPTIAILDFRPSRPENFDSRSSIHRNPIPPRFTESAAERTPSARCTTAKRCCAVSKHLRFPLPTCRPSKTSGKCSVLEN